MISFMEVKSDLKTERNWYSTRKEQGNIILLKHYGEDSSKYIHQKGDVSHAQTDRCVRQYANCIFM
jgi:hypothetical protein